jgi:hypothetical protein
MFVNEDSEFVGCLFTTGWGRGNSVRYPDNVWFDPLADVSEEGFKGVRITLLNEDHQLVTGGYGFGVSESNQFTANCINSWK